MNSTASLNRANGLRHFLSIALLPLGFVLVGCPAPPPVDETCANATITATSEDASNQFTMLTGNQCNAKIFSSVGEDQPCDPTIAPCVFEIDIVDRSTGEINPRVLITLMIEDSIRLDEAIELQRANDEDVAPATYQEISSATQDGPFWSSNSGTITFTQDEDGVITGVFEFGADNPSPIDNTATGELQVAGTVIIPPELNEPDNACGVGSASMAMIALAGLAVASHGWRGRRRD